MGRGTETEIDTERDRERQTESERENWCVFLFFWEAAPQVSSVYIVPQLAISKIQLLLGHSLSLLYSKEVLSFPCLEK